MANSILIIDDDEDDCRIIQESLFQVGLFVPMEFKFGGEEALQYLEQNEDNLPQLIILDINMPGINGMEVLEKILPKYNIIVVLYSTTCTDDVVQKSRTLGAMDCVKKGTSYTDNLKFAKRVSELIKGNQIFI